MRRLRDPPFRRPAAVVAVVAAVALMIAVVVAARDDPAGPKPRASAPTQTGSGPPAASFLAGVLAPDRPAGLEELAIAGAVSRMTLEQRVAQVFLWGVDADRADPPTVRRLRARKLGGVAVFGRDRARVSALSRALDREPMAPLLLDPEPTAPGRAGALRRSGVDGVLGPDLDVGEPGNPAVGDRAVSADPRAVASYARRTLAAYRKSGVLTAAGPFPGLGSASQPVDEGPANVSLSAKELEAKDIVPFRAAIAAGAPAIQISNGLYAYDDFVTPGSLSREVMAGLLRERLGFQGLVVSGDLTEAGVTALESPARAAVDSLAAGADLLYLSGPAADQRAAFDAVLRALRERKLSGRRLDEAAARVLAAKAELRAARRPK